MLGEGQADVSRNMRNASKLLDINSMLTRQNYSIKIVLDLLNCFRSLTHAILGTECRLSTTKLDAMDPSWKAAINYVKL